MNLIRRGSGAGLNLFRYAAKSCDSQGVVTVSSCGASDEHPMSIRSASDGGRRQNRVWKYAAMLLCLLTLGIGNAWAGGGSTTYYANLTISKSGATGNGKVYYATGSTKPGSETSGALKSAGSTTQNANQTYYWWVEVDPGYNVTLSGKITAGPATAATLSGNVACAQSSSSGSGTSYTATANIVAVTVNSVDAASKDLAPTNPSIDYPFTVTFATSNLKTIVLDLDKSPESADGKFSITSWALDEANVVASGKFNGGGSYGGANRNHSTTVSLQSKASGSAAKTCTVTANFPAMAFVSVEADDVFATQGESGKTGSATFKYNYAAEDDFPTTPTLTPTSGTGAFTVTGYTVTPDFAKGETTVTVNYSFDTNNGIGETPATLTLTAANGDVRTVTVTGHSEAAATDDAKVIAADGTTVIYQGDWATAWTKANTAANAGCTLQVLRNVTGGSLNANQKVTNTFTLDLNGKILSANYNGSIIYLNTAGKTLTIKDSKTGGRIENVNNAYAGMAIIVNAEKGNLIFESGTLYCENKGASGRRAVGIYNQAGTTVTMNGGKMEVHGYNNSQGVLQTSNKNNNTSFTMNGGEIEVDGYQDIYGVSAPGKVNINDGTINVTATYSNCRGITLSAVSNATPANCYWGTLTMKGGTINSTCTANADGTRYAYGVYFDCANTAMGTATATDGSHANKAASTGTIENATINVSTLGRYAYGVIANGSYQSKTNHYDVIQIKNTKIDVTSQYYYTYGVYANGGINTTHGAIYFANIELTDCDVTATTTKNHTAYAVWVVASSGTVYKNAQPNYYGEYAGGATVTVNSGTYTANTGTTTAYAIGTSKRAKSTYDSESSTERKLGGNAEAVAILNIHGGKFIANAGTTTARAVSNGGNCTIDGGEFYATTGTTTADGIYTVSGKLKASGVKIVVNAGTKTAYGVRVDAANVPTGNEAWTGFNCAGDAELNNLDVIVSTGTADGAYGVYVNAVQYQYLQSSFDTYFSGLVTKGSITQATMDIYESIFPGDKTCFAAAGKVVVNGGTYKVTAATTTAHGIYSVNRAVAADKVTTAATEMTVKNATLDVKTNGTTTACGIRTGGLSTIDGANITVNTKTTTCYGMIISDVEPTTVTNTKIDAKGTTTVYGIYVNSTATTTNGFDIHGNAVLGAGNDVTAAATSGNTAYAVYLHSTKAAVTTGDFAGDYANAGEALITDGTYKATATGTTAYGICLNAQTQQGSEFGRPKCTVEDGKFWGKATGGTDGAVNGSGVKDYFELKGGVYNVNTNLSTYIPEGYEEFPLPDDRPEYTEGYRYAIEPVGNHGNYVCQIGSTKYKTLEEALQVANSGNTILMIANYTLPAGDWILKSGVKLLVPYSGQTSTKETNLEVVEGTATPSQNLKLSFAEGAHLVCNGVIEAGAKQTGQGSSELTGQVYGSYGHIYMAEGSSITIESGATLYAWGYVTGKGEITIKNGGKSYEMFQFGWYKGGNTTSSIYSNRNSYKIFPMTDYSYQNIECPIMYYPGASAYGRSAVKPSSYSSMEKPLAMLVGTADNCMFRMTTTEASANTWVKKVYDPETDITNWIMNSGAAISGISMSVGVSVNSADFYLPITSNFRITLNYGDMNINNDVIFLPGSQLIINKEATGILKSGKLLFFYDAEDWFTGLGHVSVTASGWSKAKTCGYYYYPATYSPTWNTANPRKNVYARDKASIDKGVTPLPDAELFVHGKMIVNGSLYTSGNGDASSIGRNANIHSTNEDAGKIQFNTKVTGSKALYKVCFAVGSSEANNSWSDMIYGGQTTAYPAHLANGDGTYVQSSGTEAGKQYVYVDNQWQCWEENGCYTYDAQNKPYAKPAAYVQLTTDQPDANHLLHDAATGTRNFVWDQNCYWWEVVTTPTAEGYYQSINPDYNGKYNYYYYDGSANCWKIKKITVTWNIEGSTTNYSVGYGTKPEWYGGTPSKTSSSSNYYYIWDGWIVPGSETPLANSELSEVTADITFTAHFYEKYYEYNITFKNDDGSILESKNWNKGSMPSYEGTPTKNPTVDYTYEFNGTWSPAITTVTGSAVYVAQYDASPRAYTITFLNYDMSVLGTAEVVYNGTPSNATYLAAVAPLTEDPYKPDNSAFSFEFAGWRLQGASENGFAQVKGDQTYIAQYDQTTKKYKVSFVDDDGETVLHYLQLEYGQTPSYTWDNPVNKQDVKWNYTFSGWTPAEFTAVQGPQTYTATYNRSAREYKITWLNWEGSPLKETTIQYGGTPGYPTASPAPTRKASDGKTYEWDGWTTEVNGEVMFYSKNNLPKATGDATYYAHFRLTAIYVSSDVNISIEEDAEVTTTTVKVSGKLDIAENAELTTDDLILEATPSASGELVDAGNIIAAHAYFEYSQPDGFKARTWYAVAVPWQVDVPWNAGYSQTCGISAKRGSGDFTPLALGREIDLIYYDGAKRAKQGHSDACWKYVEDDGQSEVMQPGRAYMFYLSQDADLLRFERKEGADLHTDTTSVTAYWSDNDKNANWNGIANPATFKAYLNANAYDATYGLNYGQLYNAEDKAYTAINLNNTSLLVGQPVFVQATADNASVVASPTKEGAFSAPRRTLMDNHSVSHELVIKTNERVCDRIIIRAEEGKDNRYIIGLDLNKADVSQRIAQMWIDRYDAQLCVNTMEPVNNETTYPLGLYAPHAGEYTIALDADENTSDALYLTYNNTPIWNLSYAPYILSMEKGQTAGYGLKLVRSNAPAVTTSIDEAVVDAQGEPRKVLVDNQVFIIRGNNVYTIDGQLVK